MSVRMLAAMACGLLCVACGQKGPLRLPDKPAASVPAQAPASPAGAAQAKDDQQEDAARKVAR